MADDLFEYADTEAAEADRQAAAERRAELEAAKRKAEMFSHFSFACLSPDDRERAYRFHEHFA